MSSISILHISPGAGPSATGTGVVALNMSQQQRLLGQQSAVWCLDKPDERPITTEGVRLFGCSGPSMLGCSIGMEKAVGVDGGAFNVLHQHGLWLGVSRASNSWRARFGRPTVLSTHGMLNAAALARSSWKKRIALALYESENLRSVHCLHASSQAEALSYREYGLKQPIAVIPNGVSADWLDSTGNGERFRREHDIPASAKLILYLGRVHPHKGIPLLLHALADAGERLSKWELVVAGMEELDHRRELEELASALEISRRVHFLGPLYDQAKRDAFAAAQIYALPSRSENFGITIAEALGAGVPVITTKGAPWAELTTYDCGWWVDFDPSAVGNALLAAARLDDQGLKAMGQRGRALVTERYTWPTVGRMSLELYRWLLGERDCPEFVVTQ